MDLSYFNARIRGMRAGLFTRADYSAMLNLRTEKELVDRLKSSAYGPFVESALLRHSSFDAVVDAALVSGMSAAFDDLKGTAPEDALGYIGLLFALPEAACVKAVVRGIARGVKRDSILGTLIPAGRMDAQAVKMLLGAKDIEEVARFLTTWGLKYGQAISGGLAEYKKNSDLGIVEANIDRAAFEVLRSGSYGAGFDERILKEDVARTIDARNAMTLVKIAGEGYSASAVTELFIEGGRALSLKAFLKLHDLADRDELIGGLAGAIKDPAIAGALTTAQGDQALLEEKLDAIAEARFRKYSVVEPLSIALGASFVAMKMREVKNLRLIARAMSFSIPVEEIGRYLIYTV